MRAIEAMALSKEFPSAGVPAGHGIGRMRAAVTVLDSVALSVAPGELLCIVGANGSGKTTLLEVLAGRTAPTSGSIKYFGRTSADARRIVGYVPAEDDGADLTSSGRSILQRALPESDPGTAICDIAAALGLVEGLDQVAGAYSAGIRRCLAIARSVVARPRILLIDDPFRGLDALHAKMVREFLGRWARKEEAAVIYSARSLAEARRLADSVAILENTRLHSVESEHNRSDTLRPGGFRLQLRGPSVVILSLLPSENAEQTRHATGDVGVTTMDVRLEDESALFDLIRGLLHS